MSTRILGKCDACGVLVRSQIAHACGEVIQVWSFVETHGVDEAVGRKFLDPNKTVIPSLLRADAVESHAADCLSFMRRIRGDMTTLLARGRGSPELRETARLIDEIFDRANALLVERLPVQSEPVQEPAS